VLRYYLVYRALVRAKVALLKLKQVHARSTRDSARRDAQSHIELAAAVIRPTPVQLVLMHGMSGSGKTRLSEFLMTDLPAIRLRSDVERKRLFGLTARARSHSTPGEKLYSAASSKRTYRELAHLAECVCTAGYRVIVDAAFLQNWQRRLFQDLARRLAIPWTIVDCQAPQETLQQRVQQRSAGGQDASEADTAVLQHQFETAQPLDVQERNHSVCVETHRDVDRRAIIGRLRTGLQPADS